MALSHEFVFRRFRRGRKKGVGTVGAVGVALASVYTEFKILMLLATSRDFQQCWNFVI